jgi:hypothetical protein
MGRLVTIVALLVASTTVAFAEDAIDPTVWSKDQWRSDLFHTYSTHRDARAHTVVRRVVIEKTVVAAQDAVQPEAAPVRPKLMIIGGNAGDGTVSVLRPGHSCNGVLTLTWMGDHAESQCNRSTSRFTRTDR